jgi:monosaccharide-transporting ATPase
MILGMALLQMQGIRQVFPGVVALDSVDFQLEAGEIRALMGENGAGKSTLIKVLTGVYQPDSGSISLEDRQIRPASPAHAQGLGISTVYQEVNLAPNLSVAENIGLGADSGNWVRWSELRQRARAALARLNLDLDVDRPVSDYSMAIQQLVAIARAIDREAKVLVLDEPTSSLDQGECEQLFALMRTLRGQGMAIVFVTHFLEQVYAVADSITVLRNGEKVGDWATAELPREELVAKMLGRSLESVDVKSQLPTSPAAVFLKVEGIGRKKYLQPLSLEVREGEVVGLTGLLGSGRTEAMKLIYGATASDSGSVNGQKPFRSPYSAIRASLGLCPEDRKAEAIFPGLSIRENILTVLQARRGWFRPLSNAKGRQLADEMIAKLQVKTPGSDKLIEQLSGGNQQKVILARWLAAEPKCLLLDEPTRGIDVGTKLEIRLLMRQLCKRGMAFIFTSSELEEVVGTSDRLVVLRDRHKVGELEGDEVTEEAAMQAIAGTAK